MLSTVNSSIYSHLCKTVHKYFNDRYKWKFDEEEGMFKYYKGKRNLKELEFIIRTVFQDIADIVQRGYYYNMDDECNGAYIIIYLYVDADFNGANQGTAGDYLYCKFNLFSKAFSYDQSQNLDYLFNTEYMKKLDKESV
ncbi:hypothetical protein [Bacillus cereus]|uniref:hypothetical protein n=1 Tax=Bacillus cereus TaxID=1396 RepID=UPI000B4BC9F8|nr:hypothetical protein [Bacillus cereus]